MKLVNFSRFIPTRVGNTLDARLEFVLTPISGY